MKIEHRVEMVNGKIEGEGRYYICNKEGEYLVINGYNFVSRKQLIDLKELLANYEIK